MAEINLTQTEADALLKMEKISVDDKEYILPSWDFGGRVAVPLISLDKRENFILDIRKSSFSIAKQTYQTRAHEAIILVRLDFGRTHKNPPDLGGKVVGSPHIHIYKEGFADKYATDDIPDGMLSNLDDPSKILHDFMKYCNITQIPNFRRELFS